MAASNFSLAHSVAPSPFKKFIPASFMVDLRDVGATQTVPRSVQALFWFRIGGESNEFNSLMLVASRIRSWWIVHRTCFQTDVLVSVWISLFISIRIGRINSTLPLLPEEHAG